MNQIRGQVSVTALLLAMSAALLGLLTITCSSDTGTSVSAPSTPPTPIVIEKEVIKTVEVPGETVVKEVIKEVEVPGETVVVEKEVVREVMVPGETVVVEKEVVKIVEVEKPVIREVVKEVEVPRDVVIEKEVVKVIEVEKPVVQEVVKQVTVVVTPTPSAPTNWYKNRPSLWLVLL